MKYLIRKLFFILTLFFASQSFASHIVGGEITVKYKWWNTYDVTLQFFRDGATGSTHFDKTIQVGIYNKRTNAFIQAIPISNPDTSLLTLGDACYQPTLKIWKAIYTAVNVSFANNNGDGYYLAYLRCCRNAPIVNITDPGNAGYVMYCEIPDPDQTKTDNRPNSSPTFNAIPDGFMCATFANEDDFSCTDIDGDSLVYSFSTPLSCSANALCGNNNPSLPNPTPNNNTRGPYGTITWAAGYSLSNPMMDPTMNVHYKTGIVTTRPPNQGTYVFCVKVEEYRKGKKIGEVRRDFQFQTLPCKKLEITDNTNAAICLGPSKTLTANNVGEDFIYVWSPGGQNSTSIVVNPTSSGTYNYTITATKGLCKYTATTSFTVNANPTASAITPANILCKGGVGTATASGSGGTIPYSYVWQTAPIQSSATATGLTPGTYTVIISDANKCTASKTVTITEPLSALSNTITSTQTGCNLSTGTASVTITGGTTDYTYLWNTTPQQTTAQATGMPSGTYSVLITDKNGCTISTKTVVPVANGPTVTATVLTNVSCAGTNNGAASSSSTVGGKEPYQYLWMPSSQTTENATGLYALTYTVYVTDINNCKSFSYATVNEPPKLNLSGGINVTNISCYMGSNGTATITPTGGSPQYTYLWNTLPAQSNAIAIGLSANTVYSVTVTDSLGCKDTASVSLTQPTQLISSIYNSNIPACFGYSNGSATVTASNGSPGYTYLWLPTNQTTATATGLSKGNYTVTITDSHGCIDTSQVTITEPTPVGLNTDVSGFSCGGDSKDASATAFPNGGTPPYTYAWTPTSKNTQTISNISAGTYSVTMTDSKGCSIAASAVILPTAKPEAKFSYLPSVSCDGVVISFVDESVPAPAITTWLWDFGKGATSTMQNPSHMYPYSSGNHNVTLIVYQAPCYDTITNAVKADDLYTYATFNEKTNIFTPNNDGVNDCFMPYIEGNGAATLRECLEIRIFDRWGVNMFESDGTNNCWNGNIAKNNKPAVDGTYFYVAKLANKVIKGSFTLVRATPDKKW